MTTDPALLALLEQIAADVRALREAAEHGREIRPQADTSADLLRVIRAAVGDCVFTCADLVEHAALPTAAELQAAMIAAVGSTNARRIGKLLRKVEGIGAGGLTVRRVGEDRGGAIWMVAGVRE